jgi:hypothetical protein
MSIFDRLRKSVRTNVGSKDQIIRAVIGIIVAILILANIIPITGLVGLIPVIIVAYLLGTSGLGYDPFYRLFRKSTAKVQKKPD